METFPRVWLFLRGIHHSPVDPPHKRPVTRSFDVFLDLRRPEQRVEETIKTPVIWDAIVLIMASL